ncbi:MAG TPA: hypothetical protein VGE01_01565, partial [Fimbriimonas sp.]
MRPAFLALLLGVPLISAAQRSGSHASAPWSISPSNALVWNGQPYTPVGAVIDNTAASAQRALAAGVKDVIVDAPAGGEGLAETVAGLEQGQMRYLLRVNSLAPLAPGIAVEPQSYRIMGINKARTVVVRLPNVTSALVVLAASRDGYVHSSQRVKTANGILSVDVQPKSDMDHVLLIYPVTEGLEMPDFWERLDSHRDVLLTSLRQAKPGPGFRGIVNPLGRTLFLPGKDFDFVPTSPAVQMEVAGFLENRYRNMTTAMRSWSMGGSGFSSTDERGQPTATFADLARLVPLWNGVRGIPQLWDPKTDKLYAVDSGRSSIWKD